MSTRPTKPDYAEMDRLAGEYGRRFGWKASRTPFDVPALARGGAWTAGTQRMPTFGHSFSEYFDHAWYYRRGRRAAAIVAHLYHVPEDLHEVAEAHGLRAFIETDFVSWWYPGQTTMVVYVAANPIQSHIG